MEKAHPLVATFCCIFLNSYGPPWHYQAKAGKNEKLQRDKLSFLVFFLFQKYLRGLKIYPQISPQELRFDVCLKVLALSGFRK
jgi:hypothetical protein